jgi:DeoR/GlpR family transcriptional regulator of sugar metabolism
MPTKEVPMSGMTVEEQELRRRLDMAVRRMRSALAKAPFVDDPAPLRHEQAGVAARVVTEGRSWLFDAATTTEALADLRGASQDAAVLVATSRTTLGVVDEVLTSLAAAIDGRLGA